MRDEIEKEYQSLFSLPSTKALLLFALIVSFIYSLLMYPLLSPPTTSLEKTLNVLRSSLLTFASILFYVSLTLIVEKNERIILDFRRLIGLFTLSTMLSIPLLLISVLLKITNLFYFEGFIFVGIGVGITYSLLALVSIIKIGYIKPLLLANSYFVTILAIQVLLYNNISWLMNHVYVISLTIVIYSAISILTIYAVSSLGKDKNFDALDAFRGFMSAWLSRRSEKLEKVFDSLGVDRDILMGVVKFRRKNGSIKAAWIISNVHPGPFLNVASADITSYLPEKLESDTGAESISVLHGTCSHYNNLTTSEEKEKLANLLYEILTNTKNTGKTYKPVILSNSQIDLFYQSLGGLELGIVFSEKASLDDLSYQLGVLIHERYAQLGKDVIICDAHSSLDKTSPTTIKDVKPWDNIGEEILETLHKAVEKPLSKGYDDILLGVCKVKTCGLDVSDGLGSDGVASYVFEIDSEKYLLSVIDSNNLSFGLHAELRKELTRKYGFKHAIFVTTDTHEVNAVSPKEGSYPIIGKEKLPQLVKCIEKSVEGALNSVEAVTVEGYTFRTKQIRILGEEAYAYFKNLVKQGIHIFKFVLNPSLVLSSIIILLFAMIL